MNTATRLGAYGGVLALVFGGVFVTADAVVPASAVENWTREVDGHTMGSGTDRAGSHGATDAPGGPGAHNGHTDDATTAPTPASGAAVSGVTSTQGEYLLSAVTAPAGVGGRSELSFQVLDSDGAPVTDYATSHEKNLHLIVVRTDGTRFRHVHPTLAEDGTWSIPWEWAAAGTYRVYADFIPDTEESDGSAAAEAKTTVTLTRTVDVAGRFTPAPPEPSATATATVSGFDVDVRGDLVAGADSTLKFDVSRDGQPVEDLEPYLGAFDHLMTLREGDLAYLHAHPRGADPATGDLSGPEITFGVQAPTPGRYLLYLDFQVGGTVYSAPLVVDTTTTTARADADANTSTNAPPSTTGSGADHGSDETHDH